MDKSFVAGVLFVAAHGLAAPPKLASEEPVQRPKLVEDGEGGERLSELLKQAFGPTCVEQEPIYATKLSIRDKGIVCAAIKAQILSDGRLLVKQLSIAVFRKNREINTLHCDVAIFKFDRPLRKFEEVATRKVSAVELHADPDYPTDDPRKGKTEFAKRRNGPGNSKDDLLWKSPETIYFREGPKPLLASEFVYRMVVVPDFLRVLRVLFEPIRKLAAFLAPLKKSRPLPRN